jgi:opacity protein-like surface antigen
MSHRIVARKLAALSLTALGAVALAPAAQAADNGLYLGAAFTKSQVDGFATQLDLDDESFKIIAGFRPLDAFGVELNYIDLGRESVTVGPLTINGQSKAYAAFAVGYLPLAPIDLYAKAGVARWETETSGTSFGRLKDDGTEFAWGAGVQARLGSLAVRLEYESFDVGSSARSELVSLGATWTFL